MTEPRLNVEPTTATQLRAEGLLARCSYGEWYFRVGVMGQGAYLQVVLHDLINPDTQQPWTGRKWYLSPHMTDAEIVSTGFKAIMTAEEHETRENFLFDGVAIFGPHLSLNALKINATSQEFRPYSQVAADIDHI